MQKKVIEEVNQSVTKGEGRVDAWPVYRNYRFEDDDEDAYVMAELPSKLRAGYRDLSREQQIRAIESHIKSLYAPLADTPGLFIPFARLELSEQAWHGFVETYGTLGPDSHRDSYSHFYREGQRAKWVLALYEAATADSKAEVSVPDVESIADEFDKQGMLRDRSRWVKNTAPTDAADEALKEVDAATKEMLREHTCADFYYRHPGESPLRSYGFRSLLGALWLQFFFMRTSDQGLPRCIGPGCSKVLGPGGEGKKGIYKNKEYCSKACGQRRRNHDRKMLGRSRR